MGGSLANSNFPILLHRDAGFRIGVCLCSVCLCGRRSGMHVGPLQIWLSNACSKLERLNWIFIFQMRNYGFKLFYTFSLLWFGIAFSFLFTFPFCLLNWIKRFFFWERKLESIYRSFGWGFDFILHFIGYQIDLYKPLISKLIDNLNVPMEILNESMLVVFFAKKP